MNARHLRPDDLRGKRWRGLVRESSAAQAEKWSPERQREDIRRAAEELGLVAMEPTWYERIGSGERENVPELRRALADGKAGAYDVLMVLATSRFARNRAEAVVMKREFRRVGIVIYFVVDRIISGSFVGALTEGIKEVLDEHENETRRMWVAGGIRERQLSGRWHGRIPFGYRGVLVDFEDGTRAWDGALEPHPEYGPWVRRIFDWWVGGIGARAIAVRLNASGILTAQGGLWTRETILNLVTNPVYIGRLVRYADHRPSHYYPEDDAHDGRQTVTVNWPPLVAPEVWQAAVERRGQPQGRRLRERRRYPLSGVLRCGACGFPMNGMTNSDGIAYYRCHARATSGSCAAPYIRADRAEGDFAEWIGTFHLPDDWRRELTRFELADHRDDEDQRRAKLDDSLERMQRLYVWGELDEDRYRAEAARIRAERALIVKPQVGDLRALGESLAEMGRSFAEMSAERQAAVAESLVREVLVSEAEVREIRVHAQYRSLLELCRVSVEDKARPVVGRYTVSYSA